MQFRILGSPELYDEKRHRRIPLTSPKQRLLLGTLLARPNSPVPRERLIWELWGALPPRKARNTLNAHVSGLRKVLLEVEPERAHTPRIVARAAGYLLEARPAETDSGRFCLAVAQAQGVAQDDPRGAYDSLRRALGLWRGSALEGGSHGPVCAALVAQLEEERQQALEILFDCALRTGEHRGIIPELEELTAAHPLRERFHDQLMLALCRCGRGADAIRVYTRARQRLTAAHGGTPLLTARLEQISVQAPALFAHETERPEARKRARVTAPAAGGREIDRLRQEMNQIEAEQQTARSVVGYLTNILSGQALRTGGA
ncbi:AfsR/SARP family transcriptional regulator [Streptomyces sp. NBC_01481]|uniref:AfsR/SARP family transcriptional regulator n=1 Tax=Streptomyces sp. NBC_01481 TaxID=2975869 RepID=UPI0022549DA2|nr:AfsR/SARP family transcriptional regulator [Streptomyces sp. NBC_01481]MCX4582494.1 AfsR/SARP family transcriptional regulator [Streptomyces sp. NBC_01481]